LSSKVKKMEDLELVLRFFALRSGKYKTQSKGFKWFLTEKMSEFNKLPPEDIAVMEGEFSNCMSFLNCALGEHAFSKYNVQSGQIIKRMSSFNAAVFDAVAVGAFDCLSKDQMRNKDNLAISKFNNLYLLFEDADFFSAISGATANISKVKYRIEKVIEHLSK